MAIIDAITGQTRLMADDWASFTTESIQCAACLDYVRRVFSKPTGDVTVHADGANGVVSGYVNTLRTSSETAEQIIADFYVPALELHICHPLRLVVVPTGTDKQEVHVIHVEPADSDRDTLQTTTRRLT